MDELKQKLDLANTQLYSAWHRSLEQHGGDSTISFEIAKALVHLRNAKQSHETGLPLLHCVRDEKSEIWHIDDTLRASGYDAVIGEIIALCNDFEANAIRTESHIPTCPDCIKIYKEKGLT